VYILIGKGDTAMPETRAASQHNLIELFKQVVTEYRGAIKIETDFPRWEEQLDPSTLTPKLYYYYLGNPDLQYIRFSKALFDKCANDSHIEDLAKAEDIIRRKFDAVLKSSPL
jgi:hypothetical protein